MKIDIAAIPMELLLLELYNHALYLSPKFDAAPAIRLTVAGKGNGDPLVTHYFLKEKLQSNDLCFTEVNLGAGMRELNVDFNGFEVDFSAYDDLHSSGTAHRVITEIRTKLMSNLSEISAEANDDSLFMIEVISTVNQQKLDELNATNTGVEDTTGADLAIAEPLGSLQFDAILTSLKACPETLERYCSEKVMQSDDKSIAFMKDLKGIIATNTIPEKYTKEPIGNFYRTWLMLINPSIKDEQKTVLCRNLYEKYSDKYASFTAILFELPKVMILEFLKHSTLDAIYAYYRHRMEYKQFYLDVTDYFADLVKMISYGQIYTKENKKALLTKLLSVFQNITRLQNHGDSNVVQEALCCWLYSSSLEQINGFSELKALFSEEPVITDMENYFYSKFQAIEKLESAKFMYLNFNLYEEKLIIKNCFKSLAPSKIDHLYVITRNISEDELENYYQMILGCGLDPRAILSNHAILVVKDGYNPNQFPGLFITRWIPFLKSKLNYLEFDAFLSQLIECIDPVFYTHEEWAFSSFRDNLIKYWANLRPERLIAAIKCGLSLEKETHKTAIEDLIEHIPAQYFNDAVLNNLITQLDSAEFASVASLCSDKVQYQLILKLLTGEEPEEAIQRLRVLNQSYQNSVFPSSFKKSFIKHLKSINLPLFEQAKSEQLFGLKDQNEFEQYIDGLNSILLNKKHQHAQRRTEINRLNTMHNLFSNDEDICALFMEIFKAVPIAQWPYLFIYFDAQIIHWSFPHDKKHLQLLKHSKLELPKDRTNTWLQNLEAWENILLDTLCSISEMSFDFGSNERSTAGWALGHVQEALAKTASFVPDFPAKVLKKLFFANPVGSVLIFNQIKSDSIDKYDFHSKYIVDDALIASWFPENREERVKLLSTVFMGHLLKWQGKLVDALLKAPYVRNNEELDRLVLHLVNNRPMHFVNFLEELYWDSKDIILKRLFQLSPSGTEALFVAAMNDINAQSWEQQEHYFNCIGKLLQAIEYTEIDLFNYINQITEKQKLLTALCDVAFWKVSRNLDLKTLFKINARLSPEHFYAKVTVHLTSADGEYLSLFTFETIFGPANQIAITPYNSYADYLDKNPADKSKITQLICSEIKEEHTNFRFKTIQLVSQVIPNLDDHILNRLVNVIKPAEQLNRVDKYHLDQWNTTLEALSQAYGLEFIVNKCRNLGLEKQAAYLEDKFSALKMKPQDNIETRQKEVHQALRANAIWAEGKSAEDVSHSEEHASDDGFQIM